MVFVLATLAGGALGAWGAQYLASPGNGDDDTALRASIQSLESRLEAVESAEPEIAPGTLTALEDRIAALEAAAPADDAGLAELNARIEALETAAPGEAVDGDALAALTARLDAVETAGAGGQPDTALAARLDRLETSGVILGYTLRLNAARRAPLRADPSRRNLIQLGFIKRTPRGRVATAHAYEHLGLPFGSVDAGEGLFLN